MRVKILLLIALPGFLLPYCREGRSNGNQTASHTDTVKPVSDSLPGRQDSLFLDTSTYNQKLKSLSRTASGRWPVKAPYPLPGAILPFKRVVAFYGNLYTPAMGVLGQTPSSAMLNKLLAEAASWAKADSLTPVVPALHYIAVTAQGSGGAGIKYRFRMPAEQIRKVLTLAKQIDAIVFLDIQVGHSTLESEIPLLEPFLKLPQVHLGIDPEYSMKNGKVPSTSIGTYDAADINYASAYLAKLVKDHNLPPKILVVHRFTKGMVTNYKQIVTRPEVQLVINMDGFGSPAKKLDSYKGWIAREPVQFTGFKLFYKQDQPMMKPSEVLKLDPIPVYIQYQ